MPDRNFDPSTINNIYNLIALFLLLMFGIILLRLRAEEKKEEAPVKAKLSAEDVTVESFQKLFNDVIARCNALEKKVDATRTEIGTWKTKYAQLKSATEVERKSTNITINAQAKKIDQQAGQIAILKSEVIELKKKLSEFVKI